MRYYFFELLACPECKSDNLMLYELNVKEDKVDIDPEKIKCKEKCAFQKKPANEVPIDICKRCVNLDVIDGIIICKNCGRWYPIIDGIPRMLNDKYRKYHEDVELLRKYLDKIPLDIKNLMKIPELGK
ncbi:hypothetical protein Calag_0031 [Caldisphaera lagunensis DSM 15908]|uniref:Trm112p-like protein n=1 Tax=Caldisphaera lagunensis (strain DSM 15908 / JCM 11604 / ANMR 0165 / IC-154) TaxID=1056495 RepID=L0A8S7_CALLD|nr:Trm112 family protein [Caldisphaera lagunensis]AFZ69824.1 hypothetical protein Calag_0031 [Caldisphaera lagunensis DSM 15908]